MFKDKLDYKLLNILILFGIIYLCLITSNYWLGVITKIFSIVEPFIIAFAISYSLYPMVKKLRKKGLSNKLSVAIVSVVILLIIGLIIGITVPLIYNQLIVLSQSVGQVMTDMSAKF